MESLQVKLIAALVLCLSSVVHGENAKPPLFVFGDSLVDPGNNNYLPAALAKANFAQNGIDFPQGPTGRFCNGRTVVDVISDLIGVPYPPPYLQPSTKAGNGILQGVNYASAAGGILDASGGNYIQRLGMNAQISNFQNTLSQIQAQIGTAQTAAYLAKAIVTVVMGSNDFINNYLLTDTTTKYQYGIRDYNVLLLNTFSQQLTTLYNFGFRKFTIAAVGPLGCIPDQLAIAKTPMCIQSTNDQVLDYNNGLESMVNQLNSQLTGGTFLYCKVYDAVYNLVQQPANYGFTVHNEGCCGSGMYNGQAPCLPFDTACSNRHEYIFWDPYHPTEAANVVLANGLWSGGSDFIVPMNVQALVNMD